MTGKIRYMDNNSNVYSVNLNKVSQSAGSHIRRENNKRLVVDHSNG